MSDGIAGAGRDAVLSDMSSWNQEQFWDFQFRRSAVRNIIIKVPA